MNDELTPIEEQALDVLLGETLGGAEPPNLSDRILERFHEAPEIVEQVDRNSGDVAQSRPITANNRVTLLVTAVAALAATLLIATWLRSSHPSDDVRGPSIAGNQAAPPEPVSPISTAPESPAPQIVVPDEVKPEAAPAVKPPRGIPLIVETSPSSDQTTLPGKSPRIPATDLPIQAVTLVSRQVDSELRGYWDAIGIEPSSDASLDEVSARLAQALGTELSLEAIDDPQRLQVELAAIDVSRSVAAKWLGRITEQGLSRIKREERQALIDDLAECFRSGENFDRTLVGWINGRSPNASAFYAALSSGRDETAMIRRLAALTMNVDLRCTRCHDAYIEGNGRQEDYMAFAAFVGRGITRDRDGTVTVDAARSAEPYFYELADGRQRVVRPSVTPRWMDGASEEAITSVRQWSQQLLGSEALAHGVVNSLWQLVHGQPLRGRVVDPISAPHNDSLDKLENDLVQDMVSSRFNLARTLALIVGSPATKRSVPESLLPENALVAGEGEIAAAKNAVDAFAAAQPPRSSLRLADRIAQIIRSAGRKVGTEEGSSIVAQLNGNNNKQPRRNQPDADTLAADFPGPSNTLPVQWLARIQDETLQVEHLGYLAGMSDVPQKILDTANAVQATSDNPTSLTRLWWMVRP